MKGTTKEKAEVPGTPLEEEETPREGGAQSSRPGAEAPQSPARDPDFHPAQQESRQGIDLADAEEEATENPFTEMVEELSGEMGRDGDESPADFPRQEGAPADLTEAAESGAAEEAGTGTDAGEGRQVAKEGEREPRVEEPPPPADPEPEEREEERIKEALRALPGPEQLLGGLAEVPGVGDRPPHLQRRQLELLLKNLQERVEAGRFDRAGLEAWLQGPELVAEMKERLEKLPCHGRVLNATGMVLHTSLGRSPLCGEARDALLEAAGYCRLEVQGAGGTWTPRDEAVTELLVRLTGAEAALVVNNNAAAVLIALNTLAPGREVLVSRAEMVEVGATFRLPDILRCSGCRPVDVGCTNRTYPGDYRAAAGPETALLLKVDAGNYRISGATETPDLADLAALARELELTLVHDLGGGRLLAETIPGLEDQPSLGESLAAGTDLVCASGDKLLGGCQCGLLLGRAEVVEACRRNPLYRTLRCDKLTCAALEATLRVYESGERVTERIPALAHLTTPLPELRKKARRLKAAIDRRKVDGLGAFLMDGTSRIGAGAAPDRELPTRLVALKPPCPAEEFHQRLWRAPLPLHARIHEGTILLDPRTLDDEELYLAADMVAWATGTCR